MAVLLMRLAGPMQSWGTQSRFTVRDTGVEPSKSGVIGLICAALGRPRSEPVDDLAALRMGVRVDREGVMQMDYHTAGGSHRAGESYGVISADGKKGRTVTSNRYFLADAGFLVGLEGDEINLLEKVQDALRNPRWALYLGRKAFLPSVPIWIPDGVRENEALEDALERYPWPRLMSEIPKKPPERLRVVLETQFGVGEEVRCDQPIGAAFQYPRKFMLRHVTTQFWGLGKVVPLREEETCTCRD